MSRDTADVRFFVEWAARSGDIEVESLAKLVRAVTGRHSHPGDSDTALLAMALVRILDDLTTGHIDVATLIDEPLTGSSSLDQVREAYIEQVEQALTDACRTLAGES